MDLLEELAAIHSYPAPHSNVPGRFKHRTLFKENSFVKLRERKFREWQAKYRFLDFTELKQLYSSYLNFMEK